MLGRRTITGAFIHLRAGDCFAPLAKTSPSVIARSEIPRSAGRQSRHSTHISEWLLTGRLSLLAMALALSLSLAGCLARTANPTLPYVQPAQSVPVTDPTAVHMASRIDEMDGEIQRLREMIERQQAAGGNEQVIRNLQERVSAIEKQLGMATGSAPQAPVAPQRTMGRVSAARDSESSGTETGAQTGAGPAGSPCRNSKRPCEP